MKAKIYIISTLILSIQFSCQNDDVNHFDNIGTITNQCAFKTYHGNINLTTQKEVDEFGLLKYTVIDGNLNIQSDYIEPIEDPIININSLSCITEVDKLNIRDNNELINIDGLKNLTRIKDGLYMENNDKLTNIDGFESLNLVNKQIAINGHKRLENLDGLVRLTKINNNLHIQNNIALEDIKGLRNVNSIEFNVIIIGSDNLTSLEGIDELNYVGLSFWIGYNNNLLNLNSLAKLNQVGAMEIYRNLSLIDYCGLESLINNGTYGDIRIYNNQYNPSIDQIIVECE